VLLMLMGTQWYLLFNVMAGASAIPQDLQCTAELLQLDRWKRWRLLIGFGRKRVAMMPLGMVNLLRSLRCGILGA
jgi:ABC-type nitrate/sulfonate/bicarbonate transport system permease component